MNIPQYRTKPFDRLPLKKRACLILRLAGFSIREIGEAIRTPAMTVNDWLSISYEEYEIENRTKHPKSEGVRVVHVGSSNDLEYIESRQNDKSCGGGRRKSKVSYDSNFEAKM